MIQKSHCPPLGNPAASASNTSLSTSPTNSISIGITHALTPPPQNGQQRRLDRSSFSHNSDPTLRFPTSLPHLQMVSSDVVRIRKGSVLSRGMIIKTDYWATGRSTAPLPFNLRGAPNFRAAEPEGILGIYGVAQPTVTGVKTILTSLGAGPGSGQIKAHWLCTREEPVVYIGIRPFVLRDGENWKSGWEVSDRQETLEAIETRLKNDIIKEGSRYGGLFMVHEERDGELFESWIATEDVMTTREVWESIQASGYCVDYKRIPIMSDQNPGNNYLAQYLAAVRSVPTNVALIFNCGMGVVRTTFAMITAILIRRKQLMREGEADPFAVTYSTNTPDGAVKSLKLAGKQRNRDMALLNLMHIFQKCLGGDQQVPVSLLSQDEKILESLRNAVLGNFDVILSLLSVLDDGQSSKQLVDTVIDQCDSVINLRDQIVEERIRYALTALGEKGASVGRAIHALERYFFLIAFSSFLNDDKNENVPFNTWLQDRAEIRSMLRRMQSKDIYVLAPIFDLSSLSQATFGATNSTLQPAFENRRGGLEWAVHIVNNRSGISLRSGTILKNDRWVQMTTQEETRIRGVTNVRHVHHSRFFALSQPTEDGIENVLSLVQDSIGRDDVTWINLREEPLVYINGQAYVLREEAISLRNMKSYSGISAARLELIEDRLKSDIIAELKAFEGKVLLHHEQADGSIIPVFEPCLPENVKTVREVMNHIAEERRSKSFTYYRIPTTAERPPDFADIRELAGIIGRVEKAAPIVVNCQLGRGRSTQALVYMLLQQQWIYHRTDFFAYVKIDEHPRYHAYAVINNLLRVVRRGHFVKRIVDSAVQQSGEGSSYDLVESIEETHLAIEQAHSQEEKARLLKIGLAKIRRYFYLILYASYLNELSGDTIRDIDDEKSFPTFVKNRPDFKTIENEIDAMGMQALVPLDRPSSPDGEGLSEIIERRSGRILSARTILKSDFFSNLQKMSLPDRIEGAPNYRKEELLLDAHPAQSERFSAFGCGMPTVDGLRNALQRMGASGPHGIQTYWTSMREEPVLYIAGRPHVLRLESNPLENVITTGVTTDIVENMEENLKKDVLTELHLYDGRLLLHDEVEETPGNFRVTANFGEVSEADVMTPKDVFELMRNEGYHVDYRRLPVTDEQAPIPGVFETLHGRVSKALEKYDNLGLVFNCQMGRGRTTTGMIAACLVANIAHPKQYRNPDQIGAPRTSDLSESMISWDDRDSNPYLDGEYKLILQLVGVLPYGKLAKRLADRAIDSMEAVQNLRKAVYDYKLRAESAEPGSEKHRKLFEVALNYLYRYGMLIVFADFLIEIHIPENTQETTFTEWLKERREIKLALSKRSLD